MVPADTVIYATDATDAGITEARAWIRAQGLNADDCKLVKREIEGDMMCLVISKRDDLKLT